MDKYINVSNSIKINHILRNVDLADYMNANISWFTVSSCEICMVQFKCENLAWHFASALPPSAGLLIYDALNKNGTAILHLNAIMLKGHRKRDTNTREFWLSASTCGLDFWPR